MMKHVIGYLICLVFVSIVLAVLGDFAPLTSAVQARVESAVVQAVVDFSPSPYESFAPLMDLGRIFAIVFSPVGAIALGVYVVLIWALPAR